MKRLEPLGRRRENPFIAVPREDAGDAHWVTPILVGEVEFAGVDAHGEPAASDMARLRSDKKPGDVRRE